MAKSRAQRKAEARKRRAQQAEGKDPQAAEARAQHDTQVPESAEVKEAELAIEEGAAEAGRTPDAPAPSRADVGRPGDAEAEDGAAAGKRPSRRERRRQAKQEAERARAQAERRAPKEVTPERERGPVMSFFASVIKELQKVQWPDRDTLLQASAVTLIFVAIAAAFLGGMDAIFSRLIDVLI